MIDGQLALQAALLAAAKASPAVTDIIGAAPCRFYDRVPTNTSGVVPADLFPYVSFGPFQTMDDSDTCHDGCEVFAQIDAWSRAVGFPEVRTLAKALVAVLDQALIVAGFTVVVHEVETLQTQREGDGLTSRAIIRLRYVLAPSA